MKQRIVVVCLLVVTFFALTAFAAHQDIEQHRSCIHCGMDRKAYGYSRMLVVYEDGAQAGVCSLHCAVTELNGHKDKKVKTLLVADRDSHHLIDAETAIWVLGGSKRGVMTQRPTWAFATKAAAQAFVDAYGGVITNWEAALAAAREDAKPHQR